jgi:hypothetical protein
MSILNLFHWSYWFSATLPAAGWVKVVLIVLPLIFIVIGIALKVFSGITKDTLMKKIYSRFAIISLFFGILSGLWVFLRQEETPIFSARVWPLLILLITLWWLYRVIRYVVKRVPEIRKQNAERMEKEKYLPKKS